MTGIGACALVCLPHVQPAALQQLDGRRHKVAHRRSVKAAARRLAEVDSESLNVLELTQQPGQLRANVAVPSCNSVADLETLLQERDACGVSARQCRGGSIVLAVPVCHQPVAEGWVLGMWWCDAPLVCSWPIRHMFQWPHDPIALLRVKVGFIANLRNIKSHTIVEQVRWLCRGCGGFACRSKQDVPAVGE
jgi:hypothetical protein